MSWRPTDGAEAPKSASTNSHTMKLSRSRALLPSLTRAGTAAASSPPSVGARRLGRSVLSCGQGSRSARAKLKLQQGISLWYRLAAVLGHVLRRVFCEITRTDRD